MFTGREGEGAFEVETPTQLNQCLNEPRHFARHRSRWSECLTPAVKIPECDVIR